MSETYEQGMFKIILDGDAVSCRLKNIPYPAASFFMEMYRHSMGGYVTIEQIRRAWTVDENLNRGRGREITQQIGRAGTDVLNLTAHESNNKKLAMAAKNAIISDRAELETAIYYLSGGDIMWSRHAAGRPNREYSREQIESALPNMGRNMKEHMYQKSRYLGFQDGDDPADHCHTGYTFKKFIDEYGDEICKKFESDINSLSIFNIVHSYKKLEKYCIACSSRGYENHVKGVIRAGCDKLVEEQEK